LFIASDPSASSEVGKRTSWTRTLVMIGINHPFMVVSTAGHSIYRGFPGQRRA
jgi:hypothetical protein